MRRLFVAVGVVVACLAGVMTWADRAQADVLISINKSTQRMAVTVNGAHRHTWAISTGVGGGPPSGSYWPDRLERMWHSRKYDWTPMPHSIFFYHGFAIHGTYQVSRLGRRASRGCVRLHPSHAATLFALVQSHGKSNTRIVVSDTRMIAGR